MSDAPSGDEQLLALGITMDEHGNAEFAQAVEAIKKQAADASGSFEQFFQKVAFGADKSAESLHALDEQLKTASMEALQLSDVVQTALAEVSASFHNAIDATQAEVDQIDALAEAFRNEQLQVEVDQMLALERATRAEIAAAAELAQFGNSPSLGYFQTEPTGNYNFLRSQLAASTEQPGLESILGNFAGPTLNQRLAGYGTSGGMIGPSEDSGGGEGVGSAFAIGHGLSVAGHAFGSPELREAGGLVYIEESLRRVKPLADQLNVAFEASGGLIPALTTGLVALNIPMAGLLATLLPVAAGVAVVALAIHAILEKLNEGKDIVSAALTGLDTYYKTIQTGTSESINDEITKLQSGIAVHQQYADQLQQELVAGAQAAAGKGVLALAEYAASAATAELRDKQEKLQKQIDADKASADALTSALGSTQVAFNDVLVASKKTADDWLIFQHAMEGNSQSVEKQIQALNDDNGAIKIRQALIQASGNTSAEASAELQKLQIQFDHNATTVKTLTDNVLPLLLAREQEIGQYKALRQAAEDRRTEIEREGQEYLDEVNKKRDAKKHQDDEAVAATIKNAEDIKKVQEDEKQAEVEIYQRYNDKVKDLVQSALNASQDAEEKLLQKVYDLRQNAARDDEKLVKDEQEKALELEIKANRQEQQDLQGHLEKLNAIQHQFDTQGQQALYDRNFLQLIKLKETKTEQEQTENQHYTDQEAKRKQDLADQESDLARHLAYERAQRQIALQQHIEDARIAAQRELEQIGQATQRKIQLAQEEEQRDLLLAQQKATSKITLLGQEYKAELDLIYQTETVKMQIYAQALARVRAMGYGSNSSQPISETSPYTDPGSGGGRREFDTGGMFSAFENFSMAEKGPETLNIGNASYAVNSPMLVHPLQSGSVDKGAKGMGATHNWYITGSNADEIMHKVHDLLDKVIP